jgi:hypothetical protein
MDTIHVVCPPDTVLPHGSGPVGKRGNDSRGCVHSRISPPLVRHTIPRWGAPDLSFSSQMAKKFLSVLVPADSCRRLAVLRQALTPGMLALASREYTLRRIALQTSPFMVARPSSRSLTVWSQATLRPPLRKSGTVKRPSGQMPSTCLVSTAPPGSRASPLVPRMSYLPKASSLQTSSLPRWRSTVGRPDACPRPWQPRH